VKGVAALSEGCRRLYKYKDEARHVISGNHVLLELPASYHQAWLVIAALSAVTISFSGVTLVVNSRLHAFNVR
jgi:hypothetical protein